MGNSVQSKVVPTHISYSELSKATNNFDKNNKIGQGGFGSVYKCRIQMNGEYHHVAIKKLNSQGGEKQFQIEFKAMEKYDHENLLSILGYSCDNPDGKCLVCPYMSYGSLEERLAMKNRSPPLSWKVRLSIAIGIARGLVELHTRYEPPLVHRDIKSANILLDANFKAKIGDFGIAHLGNSWQETTKMLVSYWAGTPVYMAPEAFEGCCTVKMDTFSFGVVLLELLTGLPPYDRSRSEPNLRIYISHNGKRKTAVEWKDKRAGDWPNSVVEKLFEAATQCIRESKHFRPTMKKVLDDLESIE